MANPDGLLCFFEKKYANATSNLATNSSDPVNNAKLIVGKLNNLILDDGVYNISLNSVVKLVLTVQNSGTTISIQDDSGIMIGSIENIANYCKRITLDLNTYNEGTLTVSFTKQ